MSEAGWNPSPIMRQLLDMQAKRWAELAVNYAALGAFSNKPRRDRAIQLIRLQPFF